MSPSQTSSSPVDDTAPIRVAERRLIELEAQRRRIEAELHEVLTGVEQSRCYQDDGHRTVKAWAMATVNWPGNEAHGRLRTAKALQDLPAVKDAFDTGQLGIAQANDFGRTWANRRIRDALPHSTEPLLDDALNLPHDQFDSRLRAWTELADADGAHRAHQDAHAQRSARFTDIGTETLLNANGGTLTGALLKEIFDAFKDAEFAADTDTAGPGGILPRNDAQRGYDALLAIFRAAAKGGFGGTLNLDVSVVIDHETYEEQLRQAAGATPTPRNPATYRTYRSETLDGIHLDPADIFAASITGLIRRVVINSAGVVIDLGRQRRFSRHARHALLLRDNCCVYPGCTTRARYTQADHTHEHAKGGMTNPDNGDPLCGPHNRWKNHGYRTIRDEHGRWHTYRPDGTEIGRPAQAA